MLKYESMLITNELLTKKLGVVIGGGDGDGDSGGLSSSGCF